MKELYAALFALVLATTVAVDQAEAARLGSGRSVGAQRSVPMQRQAQPAAPAPQQPKQATQPTPTQPAQPAPAPAGNRWLGPIAGLAAGLGLGWLLGQSGGFGGAIGSMLAMAALAFVVMMVFRMFMRSRQEPVPQAQYAGMGNETVPAPPPSQMPAAESASEPDFRSQFQPKIPAGFDVEGFLKQAKLNFMRLQQVNDKAELQALREVTTPEMFEQLKEDLASRGGQVQDTEVGSLSASLLEVVTEGNVHWASVHFTGTIRESGQDMAGFEEVWHLQKPVDGKSGWLLAGIQQPAAA